MEIGDREGPQGKRSKYSLGKGADIQRSGRGGAAREGAEATESGRSRALSFGERQHFILRAKGAPDD